MFWYNAPLLSAFILSKIFAAAYASHGSSPSRELRDRAQSLVARQTDPATCATACQSALDMMVTCANAQDEAGCLCPNGAILQQCINCSVINQTGTLQDVKVIADSFNFICVDPRYVTLPLTIPGASTPSSSAGTSPGASVTAPLPISTLSLTSATIPAATTNQQVTIGPSKTSSTPLSPSPSQSAPSVQGRASMLTTSFEAWSLLLIVAALFSL